MFYELVAPILLLVVVLVMAVFCFVLCIVISVSADFVFVCLLLLWALFSLSVLLVSDLVEDPFCSWLWGIKVGNLWVFRGLSIDLRQGEGWQEHLRLAGRR